MIRVDGLRFLEGRALRVSRLQRIIARMPVQHARRKVLRNLWNALMDELEAREIAGLTSSQQRPGQVSKWVRRGWAEIPNFELNENFHISGIVFHEREPKTAEAVLPCVIVRPAGVWIGADGVVAAINSHPQIREQIAAPMHRVQRIDPRDEVLDILSSASVSSPIVPCESGGWVAGSELQERVKDLLDDLAAPLPCLRETQAYDVFWEILRHALKIGGMIGKAEVAEKAGGVIQQGTRMEGTGSSAAGLSLHIDKAMDQLLKPGYDGVLVNDVREFLGITKSRGKTETKLASVEPEIDALLVSEIQRSSKGFADRVKARKKARNRGN